MRAPALAGQVAQLARGLSCTDKQGCGFDSWAGHATKWYFSLVPMFLSLPLHPPFPFLSKIYPVYPWVRIKRKQYCTDENHLLLLCMQACVKTILPEE